METPKLIIRTLNADEPDNVLSEHIRLRQESIAKFPDKILSDSYPASVSYVKNQIAKNYQCIALAFMDDEAFGTLTMNLPQEFKRRHKSYLVNTYVSKPPHIREKLSNLNMMYGLGVGFLLKKHMIEEAKKRGIETVVAQSTVSHQASYDINMNLGARLVWTEKRAMKLLDDTYVDVHTFEFDT